MHPAAATIQPSRRKLLTRIRALLAVFMAGLVLSGITAFPLVWEVDLLASIIPGSHAAAAHETGCLAWWILRVREGLHEAGAHHPFLAYGTDWLAFAHLVIAAFFIAPLRDPVRNVAALQTGVAACLGVIPLALICGPIRGIPFPWRLLDCSFGVLGLVPLLWALRLTRQMEMAQHAPLSKR